MSTPSEDTDETMRLALEKFRAKMELSNRRFLQDRIDEIEARNLPTEEAKLKKMRLYWHGLGSKGEVKWNDGVDSDIVRQFHEESNVLKLQDVKTTFHMHMDGLITPTLMTDEWRQMYLDVVEKVCNEVAFREEEEEYFHIPRCTELGTFIKYANGVQDPDFRASGICPFMPVCCIWSPGARQYAFPDRQNEGSELNILESRQMLETSLREDILKENFVCGIFDEDLEVKVGFKTGNGSQREHDAWISAYVYCRRDPDDPDPTLKDWAWRVCVFHADGGNPTELYGRKPRFDSIPEFLEWYSSWYDYLDMDEVRHNVSGFGGEKDVCLASDDESD
ncbi:hypothetical protein F1880_008909 [Penicillium rolfsii]|nr:hypothetical protein F1880_008909 [Penicillium rolfsii]